MSGFTLADLAPFHATPVPPEASRDYRRFFVGWDDVHGALKCLLTIAGIASLTMNMFGYDDEELNTIIMGLVVDPAVLTEITLDKSQAGGVHEKRLVEADRKQNLAAFNAHFAIGQSATHSISHTKGGVIRYAGGAVAWEGSTNWSADGEGTFMLGRKEAGGPGYKAQNNTVMVDVNPWEVQRFELRLRAEHQIAVNQAANPKPARKKRA
jgi:hypothetical protein